LENVAIKNKDAGALTNGGQRSGVPKEKNRG
jgi:hypothetical protein